VEELSASNQTLRLRSEEQRAAIESERVARAAEIRSLEKRLVLANERTQLIAQVLRPPLPSLFFLNLP
jgi:hypothetical protein